MDRVLAAKLITMKYTAEQDLLRRAWHAERLTVDESNLIERIYEYDTDQLAAITGRDRELLISSAAKFKGWPCDATLPGEDVAQTSEDRYFKGIIDWLERDRY